MKTAFSYLRWSTVLQGRQGKDSKTRQSNSAKEWIREHGAGRYTLSTEAFIDAGKSGFKGKHIEVDEYGKAKGELMRFIQLVEAGTIQQGSILLIDDYSRFSRLPASKSLSLFMRVIEAGIGLVFTGSYHKQVIDAPYIDKNPHILQFVIGELIRAYSESEEKSRKIRESLIRRNEAMKRGEIVAHNNIPRFFAYDSATKKYIPHPENAPVVLELVQGILDGKSLFGLAGEMNKRGVKTFRRGFCWAGTSIRKILQSRTLLGEFLGQKNFLPPLIDAETFDRVQNILRNNRIYGRGNKSELPNIFKGVCFCADCNHVMNVNTQWVKEVQYRYLVCSGQRGQSPCPNKKSIRLAEIEEEFFLDYLIQEPDSLVSEDERQELKAFRAEKTTIETKIANIGRKIENLLAMGGDAQAADIPELKKNLAKLNSERAKANSALDDINAKIRSLADAPSMRENARDILKETLGFDDTANRDEIKNAVLLSNAELEKTLASPAGKKFRSAASKVEINSPEEFEKMNPALLNDFILASRIDYLDDRQKVRKALANVPMREKIRLAMPSLIGKMTVDGTKGQWFVYNRAGKMVYKSRKYTSDRNNSQRWKSSLAKWTTRNGKAVKRKAPAQAV
jgi:hypothetical protein